MTGGEKAARTILIAALGMAVPVAIGLASGRLEAGFTIGLGAMLLGGAPSGQGTATDAPERAALAALLAVGLASLIGGRGWWGDSAMIAIAGIAAITTNYSRPFAIAAIRFIVYFVLAMILFENAGAHRGGAALLFGLGALWNVAIRKRLARPTAAPAAAPTRTPTPAQRRAHVRRALRTLAGWQYPIRLVGGLTAASVLQHGWPAHHYSWIVLTVALLTQHALERVPIKLIERALGAAIGVALTWAILATIAAPAVLALLICLLATAAPIARARSYLAYSAISTPAIMLVMDFARPIGTGLLVDRLVATLLGAALVVVANGTMAWVVRARATSAVPSG